MTKRAQKEDRSRTILMLIVAANISRQRERIGATRKELARAAGVSCSFVTLIEQAEREPSLHVLARIAHALGVRLATLVEEKRGEK